MHDLLEQNDLPRNIDPKQDSGDNEYPLSDLSIPDY